MEAVVLLGGCTLIFLAVASIATFVPNPSDSILWDFEKYDKEEN